ncbi:MAG TPA: helix-hairpin-helix domain-containing protein [Blastocatellia bacterium]|nr:helix-hairpin-helix domain-containing protein [Blastocatellia bacterium]
MSLGLILSACFLAGIDSTASREVLDLSQNDKEAVEETVDWSVFLPEGEGRTEVALSCAGCHDLRIVLTQKKSKVGWRTSVQKMVSEYKAPLDREDFQTLVAYLSSNFGDENPIERLPMNINSSPARALARLPGISTDIATAIVVSRKSEGVFAAVDDLLRVKGIDPATFERIKRYVTTKD